MSAFRLLLALAGITALPAPAEDRDPSAVLTVFAAASLTDAFEDIGALYRRRHAGAEVRFNFAGSQQLAAQIEHGAAADVFAAADRRWMDRVRELGLARSEPVVFAHNRLVVVLPRGNPGRVERLQDLARSGIKLVIAAEAVPAGRYGRAMVRRLAGRPGFAPDYDDRTLANVVSEEENVKGVVAKVQLGEADAGVIYRSDVTPDLAGRLLVLEIPDDANVIASYPIVALAESKHPDAARAFIELVRGPEARAVLTRHGLTPPPPAP
jgi:molybdate transport system substrate-binding protein